ncbi:MAG: TIGR03759 family integrating conjugative element protein [Woeseia sp.]
MTSRAVWAGLMLLSALPVLGQSVSNTRTAVSREVSGEAKETPLSPIDLERSRVWGLSDIEWRRYQDLLLGIRGSVSPANLSPVEVLGIHARDDAERRHYAELWARAMFEDAERILAFQHAYDVAARHFHPGLKLIDTTELPAARIKKSELRGDDRVLFFTGLDCPVCDAVMAKLLGRLDHIAGIDIYVTDSTDSDDVGIRRWAEAHAIKVAWVRDGRVTLNHDTGVLSRIADGATRPPALFVRRQDQVSPLSYAAL